jgi:hypothetical protein
VRASFYATNSLSVNNSSFGFYLIDQDDFLLNFAWANGNWMNYYPTSSPYYPNVSTGDPGLTPNHTFIPEGSPLKRAGQGGNDIGANILYRYVNGTLTGEPLWNPASGAFPCGAIVPGVNDYLACADVHVRLNITASGVTPPPPPSPVPPPGGETLTFNVTASNPPSGGSVTAAWTGIPSPSATDWLGLYLPGTPNSAYLGWIYVNCSKSPGVARASGSCTFTIPFAVNPGTYELRLLANNGYTDIITSNSFTIGNGGPAIGSGAASVPRGSSLTATWSGVVSPSSTDWIWIVAPGTSLFSSSSPWIYVSCAQTPGTPRASGSCPLVVPPSLAPGTYELRLMANDGFTTLAQSGSFVVQ